MQVLDARLQELEFSEAKVEALVADYLMNRPIEPSHSYGYINPDGGVFIMDVIRPSKAGSLVVHAELHDSFSKQRPKRQPIEKNYIIVVESSLKN